MCPLIGENPHHAPNSCTPPGCGHTGCTPGCRTACTPAKELAGCAAVEASPELSSGSAASSWPGGLLQKLLAFTTRPSRYHGGRQRKIFAVALLGVRKLMSSNVNGRLGVAS